MKRRLGELSGYLSGYLLAVMNVHIIARRKAGDIVGDNTVGYLLSASGNGGAQHYTTRVEVGFAVNRTAQAYSS